jgi:hypothetical protein
VLDIGFERLGANLQLKDVIPRRHTSCRL